MTDKDRARLNKLARKLWLAGDAKYIQLWINFAESVQMLRGVVIIDGDGVIQCPTISQADAIHEQRISKLVNKRKK